MKLGKRIQIWSWCIWFRNLQAKWPKSSWPSRVMESSKVSEKTVSPCKLNILQNFDFTIWNNRVWSKFPQGTVVYRARKTSIKGVFSVRLNTNPDYPWLTTGEYVNSWIWVTWWLKPVQIWVLVLVLWVLATSTCETKVLHILQHCSFTLH